MRQAPAVRPHRPNAKRFCPRADRLEGRCLLATFTAVTISDVGPGSLRAAILAANAAPGADRIEFDIPGVGPHTIRPTSPLPAITDAVVIDGYTQPGTRANTRIDGADDAVLDVELSGDRAGSGSIGLDVTAGAASVVRGLAINRFGVGIRLLNMAGGGDSTGGHRVEGNFIGLDPTGTMARGNGVGVLVVNSSGNIIGGASAGARNVIAANQADGVAITGDFERVFSVTVSPASFDNVIRNDLIGTDVSGRLDRGNGGAGISVATAGGRTTIGGLGAGEGNTIAFNHGPGVSVTGGNSVNSSTDSGGFGPSFGNAILSNSIFSNLGLGIDLGGDGRNGNVPGNAVLGPNALQNYPVLTAITRTASGTTVAGVLLTRPNETYTLQFFADAVGPPQSAQGRTLLGTVSVMTDAAGRADFSLNSPAVLLDGRNVTATATDAQGDTSEFSPATTALADLTLRVQTSAPGVRPGERLLQTLIVTNTGPARATGARLVGKVDASGDRPPFSTGNPDPLSGAITATSSRGDVPVTVTARSERGMVVTTGRFSASLGDLGVGESTTVVLTIDVNPSLAAPAGAITGSFLASSDLGDLNLENSSVSTSESIAPPVADLSVGLGAPTGPLHVGQVSVWTGTVTNLGPSEPSDVVLTVTPANGLVIVGTSLGSVDPVTGVLVVPLGSLAPGASASVSITVRPTLAGKSATMTATATSSRPDPYPTNNASSASTAILPTGPRVVGPPILSLPRHRPASIFLTFSEPLAPTRARDRRRYRLTSAGRDHVFGTSDDRPVAIRRVTYDPAFHIVRLALASRPQTPLELRILGTGKTPLTGSSGLALDGNYDGVPGGDFLTRIG